VVAHRHVSVEGVSGKNDSRLVYSTGGEVPHDEKPDRARKDDGAGRGAATASPGIRLRLERRAGNRVATVVTGLPGNADQVGTLAKALKSACSTGGAFKDGVLELQGDHRSKLETLLADRGLKSKRAGG
jgi:translation initiation factor 1